MRDAVVLALAFVLTLVVATTVVPSLPEPLVYAPFMLASGLFVMHRAGSVVGAVWLVLGGVALGDAGGFWMCMVAAMLGGVLAERVFAARSVYALLGLGIVTALALGFLQTVLAIVHALAGSTVQVIGVIGIACWQGVLLLVLLYAGFVLLHMARRAASALFVIR